MTASQRGLLALLDVGEPHAAIFEAHNAHAATGMARCGGAIDADAIRDAAGVTRAADLDHHTAQVFVNPDPHMSEA